MSIALSIVPVAQIVGFAILLSVGIGRVRSAVLLLVGIVALLLGHRGRLPHGAAGADLGPVEPGAAAARHACGARRAAASWISPFAWLERVVDGAMAGAWRNALLSLAAALAYAALMIGLAAVWLRRRGV